MNMMMMMMVFDEMVLMIRLDTTAPLKFIFKKEKKNVLLLCSSQCELYNYKSK